MRPITLLAPWLCAAMLMAEGTATTRKDPIVLSGSFPGQVVHDIAVPEAFAANSQMAFKVKVPPDAPRDLRLLVFLKDKDGLWFQTESRRILKRDAWEEHAFDLSWHSADLRPQGHEAMWNAYYAARTTELGMQFFASGDWSGQIEVSGLAFSEIPKQDEPWAVVNLKRPKSPVRTFNQAECSFEIPTPLENPFDPQQAKIDAILTSPSGVQVTVPCFYDQPYRRRLNDRSVEEIVPSGRATWKFRFTPLEQGAFKWKIVARVGKQTIETAEHDLVVVEGNPHGFVRVSPKDSRYFETADGAFFYPIGQNIHAPFDARCAEMLRVPVLPNRGTFAYDDYFKKMAAHGQNAVVIWMSNWWLSIEWNKAWKGFGGLTDYHLGNAWRLDRLLESAAQHGIFVHLVLDNHGKLSRFVDPEWDDNPYNKKQGGPCVRPEAFFSESLAFEIYTKRLRYIVARWSSHPNLLGYEIMGEFNLVGSDRSFKGHPLQAEWTRRTCAYLKQTDPHQRPVTVHYSNDWRSVDPNVAGLGPIDYLVGDAYKSGGSIVPLILKTAEMNTRFGKPTFSTEFGGNWNGTTPARLHADLHAGLWSNAMTASAAAPFFWWFDFLDRYELYGEYQALSRFMQGEDRRGRGLRTSTPTVLLDGKGTQEVRAVVLLEKEGGMGWLYDLAASEIMPEAQFAKEHARVSVPLEGLVAGQYEVEFWDTFKGEVVGRARVPVSEVPAMLELPPFKIDLAFKIRRLGERP